MRNKYLLQKIEDLQGRVRRLEGSSYSGGYPIPEYTKSGKMFIDNRYKPLAEVIRALIDVSNLQFIRGNPDKLALPEIEQE